MGYPTLARTAISVEVILELLNDAVAFTGGFFEFPAVHNLHCASHVIYNSLFLQYGRRQAHRGAFGTHHSRDEIVPGAALAPVIWLEEIN